MLARVREAAAQLLGQLADGVLTFAKDVEEHESLGIGQHTADFRMEPIPLRISIALIFHWCTLRHFQLPADV